MPFCYIDALRVRAEPEFNERAYPVPRGLDQGVAMTRHTAQALTDTPLPEHALKLDSPRSSAGILILSLAREPLYVTPSAHTFLTLLSPSSLTPRHTWTPSSWPSAIHRLCDAFDTPKGKQPSTFDDYRGYVQTLVPAMPVSILLRGFGIEGSRPASLERLLILLEFAPPDSAAKSTSRPLRHHFTDRQNAVLEGLEQGLTNKEIAATIQISVHTVKEHLRQIMTKLQIRTRTGVVAHLARLAAMDPLPLPPHHPNPSAHSIRSLQES